MCLAAVAIGLLCGGCIGYNGGWDMAAYRSAIRSGRTLIAPTLEMEKQFVKTQQMLIMYGSNRSRLYEWQSVAFLGGRYELTMSVQVILSSDGTKVVKVDGEPKFDLWVCHEIHPGGGVSYAPSRAQQFRVQKWNEFRDSGYDPKILDPAYDGSTLPDFDTFADTVQPNRKVWR